MFNTISTVRLGQFHSGQNKQYKYSHTNNTGTIGTDSLKQFNCNTSKIHDSFAGRSEVIFVLLVDSDDG